MPEGNTFLFIIKIKVIINFFQIFRRFTDVLKRKRGAAKRPATSTSSRKRQEDLSTSLIVPDVCRNKGE